MKKFLLSFLSSALLLGGLSSCERHEWHTDPNEKPKETDTINLFLHEKGDGDHATETKEETH